MQARWTRAGLAGAWLALVLLGAGVGAGCGHVSPVAPSLAQDGGGWQAGPTRLLTVRVWEYARQPESVGVVGAVVLVNGQMAGVTNDHGLAVVVVPVSGPRVTVEATGYVPGVVGTAERVGVAETWSWWLERDGSW